MLIAARMNIPALILVGVLPVTSYMAEPQQTDDTPYRTSINHRVNPFGIAVSQDLMQTGEVCYGDVVYVEGFGPRMVNDVMNKRHRRRVDLFVETKAEERLVGNQRRAVYVMRSPVRACNREEAMQMAMVNAKKLRRAIDAFKKQNGREPSYEELRDNLIAGKPVSRASRNLQRQTTADRSREGWPGH